jgi:hypothetical protein
MGCDDFRSLIVQISVSWQSDVCILELELEF